MKEIIINNKKVVFENKGEHIFCTSLDIARVFEKRHTHILDIIKSFESDKDMSDFNGPNFRLVTYKDPKGEERPSYLISRDGFSFIAMGLTGKEARKWKIAFINAFNAMEKELRAIQNQNILNLLEQPKELYNLNFKTKCRDVVLNDVKKLEKDYGAKCVRVNYYRVEETYKNGKVNSTVEIGADYDKSVKIDNSDNKLIRRRR